MAARRKTTSRNKAPPKAPRPAVRARAKKTTAPQSELQHAFWTFRKNAMLAQVALAEILERTGKIAAAAAKRRDEHAMWSAAMAMKVVAKAVNAQLEGLDVQLHLAADISRKREWSFAGNFLSILADAHSAACASPAGGATGIAHFRHALSEVPVLNEFVQVYDGMAQVASSLGGRPLPDGTRVKWGPPLDDLLHTVFRQRHLGLEQLRKQSDPDHPVAELFTTFFGCMAPDEREAKLQSHSMHGVLRDYLKGRRKR